ncbi:MAG TPA: nuclear transport factor 2 family protein [Pyrinomonadaceae bacterium]|nr:nuclear transport factor 2 family protein [Pyrinomonadaceae bacterium]
MKKILVLVSMLIIAAACAAPPTNQPALDTNRNTNLAADTASATLSEADAIAKEKAIWEAIKAKDYASFADMLAEDQVEVLSDGVHDKAGSVAGVKEFEPSELTFSDWKYLPMDKDGVIVAYTVAMKGKFKGKEFPLESYHCSSAWMRRNNKWLAVFHQECPVKKAPPPPAPKDSPKPATSPAATPLTATTGADPIANEKLVWDLFKSKNYDAFATLLAPEFLEVAPDGYYDKAGSVKGVSMFDAAKAELSDFKATKLSENASLVTYMVKDPTFAPKGERSSSLWVNRAGKWMALLHHGGTAVAQPSAASPAKASPSPATK